MSAGATTSIGTVSFGNVVRHSGCVYSTGDLVHSEAHGCLQGGKVVACVSDCSNLAVIVKPLRLQKHEGYT